VSDTSTVTHTRTPRAARFALLVAGIAAALLGLAILIWPTKAGIVVTGLIAVYAVIIGISYVALAFFSRNLGIGGRIGHILLGILYVIAGVFAFSELHASAVFLGVFLTILVGVMWIMEGFVSLFSIAAAESTITTILFAIISIFAGLALVTSPVWGAVFLWWFLGIALVVIGGLNALRALFRTRS